MLMDIIMEIVVSILIADRYNNGNSGSYTDSNGNGYNNGNSSSYTNSYTNVHNNEDYLIV